MVPKMSKKNVFGIVIFRDVQLCSFKTFGVIMMVLGRLAALVFLRFLVDHRNIQSTIRWIGDW